MSEKPRKGSMLEAERNGIKKAKIIMVLVTLVIYLIFGTSLLNLYPAYWHEKAGELAKTIGLILFIGTSLPLIFEQWLSNKTKSEVFWWIAWVAILIFAMAMSAGFKFDLPK